MYAEEQPAYSKRKGPTVSANTNRKKACGLVLQDSESKPEAVFGDTGMQKTRGSESVSAFARLEGAMHALSGTSRDGGRLRLARGRLRMLFGDCCLDHHYLATSHPMQAVAELTCSSQSNDAAPRQGAELTPLPAPAICWHAGSNTYNNSSPMSAKASASAQAQISRLFPFS
eukprot:scaffold136507_cov19-Tisochrysis_lutea.AAC.1